jgi:hypothetical protein
MRSTLRSDGRFLDGERVGYLAVGQAAGDVLEHFPFARC